MSKKAFVMIGVLSIVAVAPLLASGRSTARLAPRPGAGGAPRSSVLLPDPLTDDDFRAVDEARVRLGKLLFFDKILSGNRNTSCATCHHPLAATGDGLSLSVGEGGRGLGVTRDTGSGRDAVHERVPRNAPALFNLGAREVRRMFHDGRVDENPARPSGFESPAGDELPPGLDSVVAVQAMFPVTSPTEMAGQVDRFGENPVAVAAVAGRLAGRKGVWEQLARRLRDNAEYAELFKLAFDDVRFPADISFVHAANAIAAFEESAWRADDSPFDRFLRGEARALSADARDGMQVFYGRGGCASCHSGALQTDHDFHEIAMPQIGPGKGDGEDGHEDFGRERVTGDPGDRFRFRTPSLRNVALTGPWGHDGAFNTLEAVVRHHLDAVNDLESYDPGQAVLPSREDLDAIDFVVHQDDERRAAIAERCEIEPVELSRQEFDRLIDFLHALTDPRSLDLRGDVPARVPSGLPLAE